MKYYKESSWRGISYKQSKEDQPEWSHLAQELPSRKGIRQDRNKGKTRKKTKQLLGDLKDKRGYWKLKEEGLDHIPWRTRFGRGYGPVIRQATSIFRRLHQIKYMHLKVQTTLVSKKPFCTFLIAAW